MVSSRSARTAPRTAPDTVSRSLLSTDLAVAATGPAATTTAARVDRPSRAWSTSLQHRRQQECDIRGDRGPCGSVPPSTPGGNDAVDVVASGRVRGGAAGVGGVLVA